MNTLSIIIPVLNEQECIAARLGALQQLRRNGCEIILVDGGSVDGTVKLAEPLVDHLHVCDKGRARQMNVGAATASADTLLFLHVDTELPTHADKLVLQAVTNNQWGWFQLEFNKQSSAFSIISSGMNWRASLTHVCTGDQTLFVRRDLFELVGGFPTIPLMEDVAISKILRQQGRPTIISTPVNTSTRRWDKNGIVRTVLFMWWLRLLYYFGRNPAALAKRYYPERSPAAKTAESEYRGQQQEDQQASQEEEQKEDQQEHQQEHQQKDQQKDRQKNQFEDSAQSGTSAFDYPNSRILVFAKDPVLGEVKTRLEPVIGPEKSLSLHKAMNARICHLLRDSNLAAWQLWVTADTSHEFFVSLCNRKDIFLQKGAGLGEKMANAAAQSFSTTSLDSLLIIGSDCPSIDESYLQDALQQLAEGSDVVLGPAEDGGYVLIGLRAPNWKLFEGIDWGTDKVLEQTMRNIGEMGLSSSNLKKLWDVDRPGDLDRLDDLDPPLLWSQDQ